MLTNVYNFIFFPAECAGISVVCENGGYQDPNDCTRCKCPEGFGGAFCTEAQEGVAGETNRCIIALFYLSSMND